MIKKALAQGEKRRFMKSVLLPNGRFNRRQNVKWIGRNAGKPNACGKSFLDIFGGEGINPHKVFNRPHPRIEASRRPRRSAGSFDNSG
jgi:hypothetical protein